MRKTGANSYKKTHGLLSSSSKSIGSVRSYNSIKTHESPDIKNKRVRRADSVFMKMKVKAEAK